ncbi:MAG: pantoate--beta-alanine ligase, partial [Pseudomonadota bacterium]
MSLETVRTVVNLREGVARWRDANKTVAMVPTMGAIHEGHLSLVRQARDRANHVVASIFVNPLQFGPTEDFETYPRKEVEDAAKLAEAGAHLLYAPGPKEMYPEGFATNVH